MLRRAVPNAVSILICFLLWLVLSSLLHIPEAQADALFYLLVGTVGIQAVFKAAGPSTRCASSCASP